MSYLMSLVTELVRLAREARGRGTDPDVITDLLAISTSLGTIGNAPPITTSPACGGCEMSPEDEAMALIGRAIVLSEVAYCAYEVRQQHRGTPHVSIEKTKGYCDEGVRCCREAKELAGRDAAQRLSQEHFEIYVDALHASLLSEAALNAMEFHDPGAAVEYLRQAIKLQPDQQKFRASLAGDLMQIEQAQSDRDPSRCVEILDSVEAAQRHGPYTSVPSILDEFLQLPKLPEELRRRARVFREKGAEFLVAYEEEIALYRRHVQMRPGSVLNFQLVDARVRPMNEYLQSLPVEANRFLGQLRLHEMGEMLCLVARYRSAKPLRFSPQILQRNVELMGLALSCHLGLLGERVGLRLKGKQPLPTPEQRQGPEWNESEKHTGITVQFCLPLQASRGPYLDIDIGMSQTDLHPSMLSDSGWMESYRNLLSHLEEGIQGYGRIVRPGDPEPLGSPRARVPHEQPEDASETVPRRPNAVPTSQRVMRLDDPNASAWTNRGVDYAERGEHERAIECYNKAIEFEPDGPVIYNNRGNSYAALADDHQAIRDYSEAIRLKQDYWEALNNRGTAYNGVEQYQAAVRDLDQALKLKPDLAQAYFSRSMARICLYDLDGGRADLAEARKLAALDPQLLARIAQFETETGLSKARKKWWEFWK